MEKLKDYFEALGWQGTDTMCIGILDKGEWTNLLLTVEEVLWTFEGGIPDDIDIYSGCAAFRQNAKTRKKRDVRQMKELVLDIDFKAIDADSKIAQSKADELLKTLPKPTVLIHSGNGYHVHYRLYAPDKWISFDGMSGAEILRQRHKADGMMISQIVSGSDYEQVYQRLVAWINSKYPDYLDCTWSCEHVFRLPFSNNCKDSENKKPVRIISQNDIKYTLDDFDNLIPADFVDKMPVSEREAQRGAIKNICQRTINTSGLDRSKAIYVIVTKVMEMLPGVSDVTIVSVLKQFSDLIERYANDTELRKDVRRIMLKSAGRGIAAVLPVEQMRIDAGYDLSAMDEKRKLFDASVFSSRGSNEPKFDAMLQVYDRLWDDRASGIVSVPCSSSKTFSALIYAATLTAELSTWSQKIWFVSEKIVDCQRNAEVLQQMGCKAVAYHGRPDSCTVSRRDFMTGKPCKDCHQQCGAALKYLHGLDYTLQRNDIICCTHKFLAGELAKGGKIPAALIIIDESPELFEQFELTENDIALIQEHLAGADRLADMFHAEIQDKIKAVLTDKGTHKIETMDVENYADAIKVAWIHVAQGMIGSLDKLEAVLGFFIFFKNSKNVFGMKTGSGSYRFIAGQVNIDIPDSVVWILDGSAKNQMTKWNGFKIFEVPELKMNYPNMKIKLLQGNSTKSNLAKSSTRDKLVEKAKNLSGTTMLFANKTVSGDAEKTVQAVEKTLQGNDCKIIRMDRGEHIGSNRGRAADANLICMSLFSDVTDYALRASLYYDNEIAESDIFGKQQKKNGNVWDFVKLNNGGFECSQMRDVATRSMQRDLYQAIMRGCIRDKAVANYDVVAIVADSAIIHSLQDDLPGADITAGDSDVITLWLDGKSIEDIAQTTGQKKSTVSMAIQAFRDKIGL